MGKCSLRCKHIPINKTDKKSKFTESRIAFVLKQAETGVSVEEVCSKTGIYEATFIIGRENMEECRCLNCFLIGSYICRAGPHRNRKRIHVLKTKIADFYNNA